ncbi:hypothetical protein D3H55_00020 [Bacillus salacetis]|uniref:YolD-like family protein n=1 Tax=Bacillus salacetis TaxID=2315464 RepID=A0A3A1RCV7_9BACI|nr:hypothetical protein [Bacillus salacetis]RIW38785.1 hypothetical protein D3H55_00020 [Bacillus salacetis]
MTEWENLLRNWQLENKLLRVEYLTAKKGKSSFSGRLLQFYPDTRTLIFYMDDTKSVISLYLNQIENINAD